MDSTIEYYNSNADKYCGNTQNLDLSSLYKPFLSRLPSNANILDLGCGSGRDTKYFSSLGHTVTAIDPSSEMVKSTRSLCPEATVLQFVAQEIDFHDQFDGIWACASLLHVPKNDMHEVFNKIVKALKPSGVIYCSFKYGTSERQLGDRMFNDYDEESFKELVKQHPELVISELWFTDDIRPGRSDRWLNAVLSV